jgi:hypothetical protein
VCRQELTGYDLFNNKSKQVEQDCRAVRDYATSFLLRNIKQEHRTHVWETDHWSHDSNNEELKSKRKFLVRLREETEEWLADARD